MARNLQARRKLSELYRRGVEVRFGPDGGKIGRLPETGQSAFDEPISDAEVGVWICPPSPNQRDQAMRDAQAAKARALIRAKRDNESEEYLTLNAFLADMSEETLIEYILNAELEIREQDAIREVLAEDEWKDINDLQDALRQFDEEGAEDDDPEFAAVLARDAEYGRQVQKRVNELTDAARESMARLSRQALERRAGDKRLELVGAQRFMEAFELHMAFYGVRDAANRQVLFFDTPREFSEQDDIVQRTIKQALGLFINDGNQAKNSSGAAPSSAPSEPPSEPETSESSTPATASA